VHSVQPLKACGCFDYFEKDDTGRRCGAPLGCAVTKTVCSTTKADASNTLYMKHGTGESDGIAFSSMSTFGRDVTAELVAAAAWCPFSTPCILPSTQE
jgi:hypothetical protein